MGAATALYGGCPFHRLQLLAWSLPWKRNGTIKEFGKAGVFLLSATASYITGPSVAVDGGMILDVWPGPDFVNNSSAKALSRA